MTLTERNFTKLAISYLEVASDQDLYSYDRQRYLDAAKDVLSTLIEEEDSVKDGDKLD